MCHVHAGSFQGNLATGAMYSSLSSKSVGDRMAKTLRWIMDVAKTDNNIHWCH